MRKRLHRSLVQVTTCNTAFVRRRWHLRPVRLAAAISGPGPWTWQYGVLRSLLYVSRHLRPGTLPHRCEPVV